MSHRLPSFGILDWPVNDLPTITPFMDLVDANPFIYRVYSDQSHAPLTSRGFVASLFKNRAPGCLPELSSITPSFEGVVNRIAGQNLPSCMVSASFSFTWAVFEAFRRSLYDEKKSVGIAIIHARGVASHAMTSLEAFSCLTPLNGKRPHADEWERLVRLANARSEVLVNGQIPLHCIEAVIHTSDLLTILPPFYKRDGKLIFRYERDMWSRGRTPQIQLANDALIDAFDNSVQGRDIEVEVAARRKMAIRLALGTLELQRSIPDPSTEAGYEPFVTRASLLAFELAHFPSPRFHVSNVVSHLRIEDVDDEVRDCLHQAAIDEAVRALYTNPQFRRKRAAKVVVNDLATIMSVDLANPGTDTG